MLIATVLGLVALVAGLVLGWPVRGRRSIIFTVGQMGMRAAKTAGERNDVKMSAKLAAKEARRRGM
jgi:FtsZ-interacting cell division protein ZipA